MNMFLNLRLAAPLPAALLSCCALTQGCGIADKGVTEATQLDYGPQIAVPDGIYLVGINPTGETVPARTVCASDNSRPVLSEGVPASANLGQLIKFGDLTAESLTITVKGKSITKAWSRTATLSSVFPGANTAFPSGEKTCTVTWTGTLTTNLDGVWQEDGAYQVGFVPVHCEFEVHNYSETGGSAATGAWIPNSYFTTALSTSTATAKQNAWNVTHDGATYTLTMPDSVAATQTQYACPNGSHVVKMVMVQQSSVDLVQARR